MIAQQDPWTQLGDPDPESAEPAGFEPLEGELGVERGRPKKAATAFRTISEVADDLHVPQHVLRFWETRFPQVKPLKRGGGRRYYRPDDVVLLRRISDLLYVQGYTIKGVQRLLLDGGDVLHDVLPPPDQADRDPDAASALPPGLEAREPPPPPQTSPPLPAQPAAALSRQTLGEILAELEAMRRLLPGGR